MSSFELAFNDTERAAAATIRSAASLVSQAKRIEKAAKEGNIAAIKRAQSELGNAVNALAQEVDNAVKAWPFHDDEEVQYLRDSYADELCGVAAEQGLTIYERDDRLIASPSMVRVLPADRAVRIDRKKVTTIRPSHLASLLLQNQRRPVRFQPAAFLEALFGVYSEITREGSSSRLMKVDGRVVPLERVYNLITALPGSRREYDSTDFARDLYLLEASGQKTTRSGNVGTLTSPSTNRSGQGVFTFVGSNGQSVLYYGIRFAKAD